MWGALYELPNYVVCDPTNLVVEDPVPEDDGSKDEELDKSEGVSEEDDEGIAAPGGLSMFVPAPDTRDEDTAPVPMVSSSASEHGKSAVAKRRSRALCSRS